MDRRLLGNCSLAPNRDELEAIAADRKATSAAAVDIFWLEPAVDDMSMQARARRVIRHKFGRSLKNQGGIVVVGSTDFSDENAVLFHVADFPWLTTISQGDCADCIHSFDGRERGYNYPCVSCTRPSHCYYQGPDDAEPYDIIALREKEKANV